MPTIWRLDSNVSAQWQATHDYSEGDRVVCTSGYGTVAARGYVYRCSVDGGSSGGSEPTWVYTTPGTSTTSDGDLTWVCEDPDDWDNAHCYISWIMNNNPGFSGGDTVYVDDSHYEITTTPLYVTIEVQGGTKSNPTRIYCVDKTDDSLSTGAIIEASGYSINVAFYAYGYSYGVTYKTEATMKFDKSEKSWWTFEHNGGVVLHITTNDPIKLGYAYTGVHVVEVFNGNIQIDDDDGKIHLYERANFIWKGGSLIASNGTKSLFWPNCGASSLVEGVDLSACGDGANARSLADVSMAATFNMVFSRCKLPDPAVDTGFAIISNSWASSKSGKIHCHHCSYANSSLAFQEESPEGTTEDETSIYLNASDGTTSFAYKMTSNSDALEFFVPLRSPPIHAYTSETTSTTYTIEGVWDSATNIQDDEIWMELEYPADATSGLGAIENDRCAPLGTPADQASSSVTWTGTGGFSNENKFKLSVTVTPGKAGPITARVYLAKPSTTVYIDPIITES